MEVQLLNCFLYFLVLLPRFQAKIFKVIGLGRETCQKKCTSHYTEMKKVKIRAEKKQKKCTALVFHDKRLVCELRAFFFLLLS